MHALSNPRRRAAALLLAVLVALGGSVLGLSARHGSAHAAPVAAADFGPGTVPGALVAIQADSPRGQYIDEHGVAHCLPSGPHAVKGKAGDYPNPDGTGSMWFSFADAECDFQPDAATSTTIPAAGEHAPVLAANGAATSTTARLKWSDARPDAGETISSYVVQVKVVGSTWGTAPGSPAVASPLTVAGLDANTSYVFRVRAEYVSGADGPWSNEVPVKTAEVSASGA